MQDRISTALEAFRAGDDDKALGALLELSDEILPLLTEAYRCESDAECRAFLVRAAWERAERDTTRFLIEALNDSAEEVWQSALDGTVALASPEILELLKSARTTAPPDPETARRFQVCLDEAILYVEGLVRGGQRPRPDYAPPAFKK
jgi:hypothetical protein